MQLSALTTVDKRIRVERYGGGGGRRRNSKLCKENEESGYGKKLLANSVALGTLASESAAAIKSSVDEPR